MELVIDKETGEVLDELAGGGASQLVLFEGHKVEIVEEKLKAANLKSEMVDAETKAPKLYSKKYFVVSAKVINVAHGENKDGFLVKTASYEVQGAKEIDKVEAERILAGM